MGIDQVVACAPFRQGFARPLTNYEWTVVRNALRAGYSAAGVFAHSPAAVPQIEALRGAIAGQNGCPAWRTSMFGPAPAVAPYAYECLAAWFATLDPGSQSRALFDIANKGLLCSSNPPWMACPHTVAAIGAGRRDLWEGAPQMGDLFTGAEACAWPRRRTSYSPMTGKEMLETFRLVGGTLPPQMEQAANFGAQFLNRDFLIGIQMYERIDTQQLPGLLAGQDLLAIARLSIEDMAVIWAPGQGASIKFLLDGQVDPNKIMALLQMMMGSLLPDLIPQLPNIIPQLIPQLIPLIFGSASQILPSQFSRGMAGLGQLDNTAQPGTPADTGVEVIDKPGDELSTKPPPIPGLDIIQTPRGTALLLGAAAAMLVTALLFTLSRRD